MNTRAKILNDWVILAIAVIAIFSVSFITSALTSYSKAFITGYIEKTDPGKVKDLLRRSIREVSDETLQSIPIKDILKSLPEDMRSILPADMADLPPKQLKAAITGKIDSMPPEQVKKLMAEGLKYISVDSIKYIPKEALKDAKAEKVGSAVKGGLVVVPFLMLAAILAVLLFYVLLVQRQTYYLSYAWYIIIATGMLVVFSSLDQAHDRLHLIGYFILSLLFFKALHHHLFDTRLYIFGAIFACIIAVADEILQMATHTRAFSFADLGTDAAGAVLAQMAIYFVVRPKLKIWQFKLDHYRNTIKEQEEWLKKYRGWR